MIQRLKAILLILALTTASGLAHAEKSAVGFSHEDSAEFFQPADVASELDVESSSLTEDGLDPDLTDNGSWAYEVLYLPSNGSATTLAAYRAKNKMIPASTMKLLTGYMAYTKAARPVDYLRHMLQMSDNKQADSTFSKMGGFAKMRAFYKKLGLPVGSDNFYAKDGSGLSYSDRVTPNLIMALLQQIFRSNQYQTFRELLSQPNSAGTLYEENRLQDVAYPIYAKTGTLANAKALAGYVELNHGTLIFSIFCNQQKLGTKATRDQIDNFVRKYIQKAEAL